MPALPHSFLPSPRRRLRPGRRALRGVVALMLAATAATASSHEGSSPAPSGPVALRPQAADWGLSTWSGRRWPGPMAGRPEAPSAAHCRRAPHRTDWPEPAARAGGAQGPVHTPAVPALARAMAPEPEAATRARARAEASAEASATTRAELPASKDRLAAAARAPAPQSGAGFAPVPLPPRPADEPVTAGVVDDNADFGSYLAYRQRRAQSGTLGARFPTLDVSVRHRLTVHDAAGRPVPDAIVSAHLNPVPVALWARTDAAGRTWLHPAAAGVAGQPLVVRVEAPTPQGWARGSALLRPGQRDALQITLDRAVPAAPTRLDLVFLVDATGSMGDEIDKLKRSLRSIAGQIARLPQAPDVCWGLVAYRDRGDAFFVRTWDFTDRLDAFQDVLDRLQAAAGGDTPEALNEGLHAAVHRMSWRGDGATRMALLVADAPPHLPGEGPGGMDADGEVRLDHDTMAAQAQGIKLMTLGASGLDARGEFAFRQMAQYTGGRFVFLTYAQGDDPSSGPGRQTGHEVEGYSVESLDRLIVRLVREELDARAKR